MSDTLTVQPSNIDCYLHQEAPTTNYGQTTTVLVRSYPSGNCRPLLKFDFSALPDTATISAATLSLYASSVYNEGITYWAYELTQTGWIENEACWDHYEGTTHWATGGGDYTTTDGASATVPAVNNWMNWDVLNLVKHFQSTHSEVAHFLLKDETEDAMDNKLNYFRSRTSGGDTALRPKLVIVYTAAQHYTLTAQGGSYTKTGQTAVLKAARKIPAGSGSYSLTGQAVGLKATRKIAAGAGSYSLTGQAAGLKAARKIAAGPGSYALTGQDVVLRFMGHNFESGTYLKFDAGFHLTKIYFPNGTLWGYAEFDDNVTRIYLSNGTPWGYLAFDEQTNATRIYLADETFWGYFKSSEASDVAKIYLADGTLWGEAGYNGELDQTDIYQY